MEKKKWYKSKGIWGGIMAIVLAGLQAAGNQFDIQSVTGPVVNVLTAVAAAFGVYGRKKANTEIE